MIHRCRILEGQQQQQERERHAIHQNPAISLLLAIPPTSLLRFGFCGRSSTMKSPSPSSFSSSSCLSSMSLAALILTNFLSLDGALLAPVFLERESTVGACLDLAFLGAEEQPESLLSPLFRFDCSCSLASAALFSACFRSHTSFSAFMRAARFFLLISSKACCCVAPAQLVCASSQDCRVSLRPVQSRRL